MPGHRKLILALVAALRDARSLLAEESARADAVSRRAHRLGCEAARFEREAVDARYRAEQRAQHLEAAARAAGDGDEYEAERQRRYARAYSD